VALGAAGEGGLEGLVEVRHGTPVSVAIATDSKNRK